MLVILCNLLFIYHPSPIITSRVDSVILCAFKFSYSISYLAWWWPTTIGVKPTPIARCLGSTWGPSGADRTQVGPMLAPWTLLSGYDCHWRNATLDLLLFYICGYIHAYVYLIVTMYMNVQIMFSRLIFERPLLIARTIKLSFHWNIYDVRIRKLYRMCISNTDMIQNTVV